MHLASRALLHVLSSVPLLLPLAAPAQVPADLREPLREIGPVINPSATAALYAGRHKPIDESMPIKRDIAYGPDPRHLLDIVGAGTGRRPVIVFVHGGAFVGGNKKLSPTSPYYDNVGAWAARNGFLGVTMTYRLAPQHPWPAGPEDIGRAIAWLRTNAETLGADPGRIWLVGHSAGASHVAAYVAHSRFHAAPGAGISGALLLSGVYRIDSDLVAASPTYPSYFGSDPSLYAERSSLEGLVKTDVPLLVARAELDPPSFRSQAQLLRSRLEAAGRAFTWAEFDGHGHMSEAYSIGTQMDPVGDAMLSFIKSVETKPVTNAPGR